MLAAAIYARLSTTGAVTALVSTRIYPGVGPENMTYPAILIGQIDAGAADARPLSGAAEYFRTLQQVDIYSQGKGNADAIAVAVRGMLDGIGETTWGGVSIKLSSFIDQFDSDFEQNPNLHRIIQQYRIVFKEA